MAKVSPSSIAKVRSASRDLVRELGFMSRTLAGTGLPPSAVHAIIEIGAAAVPSAKDLSEKLLLEKSTISRLVRSLAAKGLIRETRSGTDRRIKHLSLTRKGSRLLAAITRFAELRVSGALALLPARIQRTIMEGLQVYSAALSRVSGRPAEPHNPATIRDGYQPGVIGRMVEMHGEYYSRMDGFHVAAFEAIVAGGLAEFMPRLGNPNNGIWTAEQDGRIVGGLAIDGEDLGKRRAHLRWFIMDDLIRGTGVGKLLLKAALKFCDARGFSETRLWTFQGLDAARHLYERTGFALADEHDGDQWGTKLTEQVFVRPRSG